MFTNVSRPSAVDVLRPFTAGDQFYADTTSTLAKQAIGTTGQVQTVAGGIPAWSFSFNATAITAATSSGILLEANNGTDVALLGAGGGSGATFYGGVTLDTGSSGLTVSKTTGTTVTVSSTQAATSTSTGSIVTSGGIGIAKEFWAGARSRVAINGDSAQFSIQRTGTSSGLIYWGASGDRDTTNTYDTATVYNTSLGNRIEFKIIDSSIPEISATGSGSTGVRFSNTTNATSSTTGSLLCSGGGNFAGNLLARQGSGLGLTSTATAAATTTLTATSTVIQIFTGSTTQTLQLPAASLFGSGIAVEYIVVNRSTGTVTAQRAGSDTFDGGGTTDAILTNTTRHYVSNGSNQWHTIA